MTIREMLEENERKTLSPYAQLSSESRGREHPEEECPIRPAFQHDRDRILHSKAFRRLKHKTQVFFYPSGDHYRTRLTHTLEVSQIARTIAKALRLNEDLTEAIALGHDLGHTPFGHAGEEVLNRLYPRGFKHNEQSLRIVRVLERDGRGLNLTFEVRDGILKHSKGRGDVLVDESAPGGEAPVTVEGEIMRVSDLIAYVNHDVDDAIRAGLITPSDLPSECVKILGSSPSARIDTMVKDAVRESYDSPRIRMGEEVLQATLLLRDFLYERVYTNPRSHQAFEKAEKVLAELYEYYLKHYHELPEDLVRVNEGEDPERAVCDFLAGMTDRFALNTYERLFLPQPWMEM